MKLRSYQKQAVDAIFDAWQKFKSVLVVLPTGCGKTVVFASVIRRLMTAEVKAKGEIEQKRVVVLAHREELVTQARDKITAIVSEADVQVEMADFKVVDYFGKKPDVVVSTVQTQCAPLGRKVKVEGEGEQRMCKFDPSEFAAVVIDEAHHDTLTSNSAKCIATSF